MSKGVIFDMDGVLVESEEFYYQRRIRFFEEKGIVPGSDNLLDHVGKTDRGIWEMLIPHDSHLRQALHEEYKTYREAHPIDYPDALRKEVPEVLGALKEQNIKVGLASSSARKEINQMLSATGLASAFDYVLSGEELKESKPNPEIYLKTASALGCADYLAVEDSVLGIRSAKAAGLYTVALKQSYPVDQSEADIVITDLRTLLNMI